MMFAERNSAAGSIVFVNAFAYLRQSSLAWIILFEFVQCFGFLIFKPCRYVPYCKCDRFLEGFFILVPDIYLQS